MDHTLRLKFKSGDPLLSLILFPIKKQPMQPLKFLYHEKFDSFFKGEHTYAIRRLYSLPFICPI